MLAKKKPTQQRCSKNIEYWVATGWKGAWSAMKRQNASHLFGLNNYYKLFLKEDRLKGKRSIKGFHTQSSWHELQLRRCLQTARCHQERLLYFYLRFLCVSSVHLVLAIVRYTFIRPFWFSPIGLLLFPCEHPCFLQAEGSSSIGDQYNDAQMGSPIQERSRTRDGGITQMKLSVASSRTNCRRKFLAPETSRPGGRNLVITCSDHFGNPMKVEVIFFGFCTGKATSTIASNRQMGLVGPLHI